MLEPQSPHTAPHGIGEEEEQPPLEVHGRELGGGGGEGGMAW